MTDLSLLVVSSGGLSLSLRDWLVYLKRRGQLLPLLRQGTVDHLVARRAAEAGLSVTDAELQAAADAFRRRHGLASAADTGAWLARQGLTVDDFERSLEADLLAAKFRDHLTRDRLPGHFAAHRDRYARARLREIVVASEGTARELLAQVADEGSDFAELARAHSLDDASRPTGGSLGTVPRLALLSSAAEAIFSARRGAVVGPVATDRGYALFLVEELLPAELDEATAALIRRELFDAWLAEQLRDLRVDLSWLGAD
jgi:putative peptide maturation system protein